MRAFRSCRSLLVLTAMFSPGLSGSVSHAQDGRIVVVEVPGGEATGRRVRRELARQLDVIVLSPHEAAAGGQTPNVMLAASIDASSLVKVQYRDRQGASDLLSAPMPASGTTLEPTIATLAAALLSRHAPQLHPLCQDPERELADCTGLANLGRGIVSLTSLGVPHLRSAPVTIEDF